MTWLRPFTSWVGWLRLRPAIHMFGVQVEWARRFGGVPVYVQAADREWVQRDDPVVTIWEEKTEVLPGVVLHRIGGHFPGGAVVHLVGADGHECC